MSNESPFPYTVQGHPPAGTHGNELEQELESLITHPRYDLVESAELPPSTSAYHDNVPQLDEHQPEENYAVAHYSTNYADYGHWAQYHDNPYRDNPWHEEGQPRAPATNLEGQSTYQSNPMMSHPAPGNAQHMHVLPGLTRGEYYIPPAHDIPNDRLRDRPPLMPDVADPPSRSVLESVPSRMLAMEGLKRLAERYLQDPSSQVDTLRMGLSPSSGRLRVMIVLDIDI